MPRSSRNRPQPFTGFKPRTPEEYNKYQVPEGHLRPLMSLQSFRLMRDSWPKPVFDLVYRLCKLPVQYGASMQDGHGFVLAIDLLRDNKPALAALAGGVDELVDTLEVRPTYEDIFALVDRLLAFKVEVNQVCQDVSQHRGRAGQCKFRRGN
jgi:hypothetical protein